MTLMHRVESVSLQLDHYKKNGYLTHNLHPYPAKFIPQIPREIICRLTEPGDWVLDPFCGSGTSVVESVLLGRNCVGTDINPLSCKISRAKIARFSDGQLRLIENLLEIVATPNSLASADADAPRFYAIDKWFSKIAQRELAALLSLIRSVEDAEARNFLEVVFSAIVVKASNQESDTRYKAIEKNIQPDSVRAMYYAKLRDALARVRDFISDASNASAQVVQLDSTASAAEGASKFRLAVTSPPYMNSYDYYLYHKHRMNWLGLDVAETQDKEFGSRNKHNDKGLGVDVYNESVKKSIELTREVLAKDGVYCVIVGDAIWRGDLIKMNLNYDQLFESSGYRKVREIVFPQRKYTRSFTANLRTAHKDSYVLVYARG